MSTWDDGMAPLTEAELARASDYPGFWIVWYEDRFDRDETAMPHDAFLLETAARARAAELTAKLGKGSFERHQVTGPHSLEHEFRDQPREFRWLLGWLEQERNASS